MLPAYRCSLSSSDKPYTRHQDRLPSSIRLDCQCHETELERKLARRTWKHLHRTPAEPSLANNINKLNNEPSRLSIFLSVWRHQERKRSNPISAIILLFLDKVLKPSQTQTNTPRHLREWCAFIEIYIFTLVPSDYCQLLPAVVGQSSSAHL